MAFDSPKLGGYTLQNPPDRIEIYPEVIQELHELADGGYRQRIKGYRIKADLFWESNWIRSQDFTGLMAVANDASASLTFLPRPTTFPTRSFAVIWTNKFEFKFNQGRFGTYAGQISLVSPTTTSTITDLP